MLDRKIIENMILFSLLIDNLINTDFFLRLIDNSDYDHEKFLIFFYKLITPHQILLNEQFY